MSLVRECTRSRGEGRAWLRSALGLVALVGLGGASAAQAQTIAASCGAGDSPLGVAASCDDWCDLRSGSTQMVCDISACSGSVTWTIISDYSGTFDEVAYGDCAGGTPRCCGLNDSGGAVGKIWIVGGDSGDDLHFHDGSERLELNAASSRVGIILGGEGADFIDGSTETASAYAECLYGQDHPDLIYGNAGDDILAGGQGNDEVRGNGGDDCVFGGLGIDELYGGNDDDFLYDTCQGNGTDFTKMVGGPNDDVLFYAWDATCGAGDVLSSSSDCDNGTPAGTNDEFLDQNATQGTPSNCDVVNPTPDPTCPLTACSETEPTPPPPEE